MVKSRSPHPIAPDLLDRVRERFRDFPLTRDWQLSIDALLPGKAQLTLVPTERTVNGPSGVVNGGVLATLADIGCAMALCTYFDGRMPFATSDLHIRYLEPADRMVLVQATVLRASLRSAILECQLLCEDRMVGLCTAHFSIQTRTESEK
jgi:acyl-coenzyme A thioesterase PaaI-like protein